MTKNEFKQFAKLFRQIIRIGSEFDYLDSLAHDYDSEKDKEGPKYKDPDSFWHSPAILKTNLKETELLFDNGNVKSKMYSKIFFNDKYRESLFNELKDKIEKERLNHQQQKRRIKETNKLRQEKLQKAMEEDERERAKQVILKFPDILDDIIKTKEGFIKLASKTK